MYRFALKLSFCAAYMLGYVAAASAFGQASADANELQLVPQTGMNQIVSVAFSRDGLLALLGGSDGKAVLWDLGNRTQIRSFSETSALRCAVLSPDGKLIVTVGDSGVAVLWDALRGLQIRRFSGHRQSIMSAAFSADGHRLVTGSLDHTARLWDVDSGRSLMVFDSQKSQIFAVAISSDGRKVLTGGDDHAATLWDSATGAKLASFTGHTDAVTSVAFSPDGTLALTGSLDRTARLWNAATGSFVRSFIGHKERVLSVAFAPKNAQVLTGSMDKTAKLWDVSTGAQLATYNGHSDMLKSVAFSPDGNQVLTGSADKTAVLWETATARQLFALDGFSAAVNGIALSADQHLLLTASSDALAHIWDTSTGQPVQTLARDGSQELQSAAFSPDGRYALTSSYDAATLWDLTTGKAVRSFAGQTNWVLSAVFSPNGQYVLTETFNAAELWDAMTGAHIRSFTGHTAQVTHVAFSPDGKHILTNREDQTAQVWEVSTGNEERNFQGPNFSGSFSPDSRYVLVGGSPSATLWDLASGQEVRRFRGHEWRISSVAFSADGKTALTGSWDHTAKLWDVASGKELVSFNGHTASVTSVAFSGDGRFVITGSEDSTTRFWDGGSGSLMATLMSFRNGRWAVADRLGRFDTNLLDGGAPLAWVLADDPLRALPLSIFTRDYFTPGLLARLLKGERLPPVRSIREIKNRLQPIVAIESVKLVSMSPRLLEVTVQAKSSRDSSGASSGVQDLHLFRDGQLLPNGIRQGILHDGNYVFTGIQVKRGARRVVFTAYAFNSERIQSATISGDATLSYDLPAPAEPAPQKPKAFLLQVGVNHTLARGCELKYSVNDAETMSATLNAKLQAQGFDVRAMKLESAPGSDASGAAKQLIRAKLNEIAAQAMPDDVLFMSFSGHGYSADGGTFYVLPSSLVGDCSDANPAARAKLLDSAISADELAEWLRPIDVGEATLILDACQSAESVQANDFKPGPMGSRGLGQLAYDKRMRILAASQSDETAGEYDSLRQGLLSYVLTKDGLGAGKADWKPRDGKITVGEWLGYAANAVPQFKPDGVASKDAKGFTPAVRHQPQRSLQVPAVFDFSKNDAFVLQQTTGNP